MNCGGTNRAGTPCGRPATPGATVCVNHGSRAPQVAGKAAVRAELMQWTLGTPVDDPGETLLRLITQSRMRADLYGDLLQQAYDAAERMSAGEMPDVARADAERDLEVVLQYGGVSALIGKTYGAAGKDGVIFATGEAIRGLASLESQERERCARFCKLAIDAGLAERIVRIHERQAAVAYTAITAALVDAGLDDAMRRTVMGGVARHLRAVPS